MAFTRPVRCLADRDCDQESHPDPPVLRRDLRTGAREGRSHVRVVGAHRRRRKEGHDSEAGLGGRSRRKPETLRRKPKRNRVPARSSHRVAPVADSLPGSGAERRKPDGGATGEAASGKRTAGSCPAANGRPTAELERFVGGPYGGFVVRPDQSSDGVPRRRQAGRSQASASPRGGEPQGGRLGGASRRESRPTAKAQRAVFGRPSRKGRPSERKFGRRARKGKDGRKGIPAVVLAPMTQARQAVEVQSGANGMRG